SEIARPWLVVSAGCSPAAIWCNSPPAAGCESPVGAEPFFCLRFPDVLVVILLPLIDLLVVNVSLARSRLIIPSFCRVNQDFHFGFLTPAIIHRNRIVIGVFVRRQIPDRYVFVGRPFDLPRTHHSPAVAVQQHPHHHRRVVGRHSSSILTSVDRHDL